MERLSLAKEIALYIVEDGTEEALEGNQIYYVEELANSFEVHIKTITDISEDIIQELCLQEAVADASFESDSSFYVTFYTDFCPNTICDSDLNEEF